jgi:hypothetical protein
MMNRILRASAVVFALLLSASSASAATLTLQWDRNAEPTVTGYVVSYGTKTGTYTNTVDVGNQVTATLTLTPTTTTTYFFAVRAYTPTTTSAYSTEVSTTITIVPSQATLNIDGPVLDSIQNGDMLISGWAVDKASTTGTGIDAIHVYAYPNPGSGAAPVFLGQASYGGSRPDVAAALGAPRYTSSGFTLPVVGLTPGVWQVSVYGHSSVTSAFAIVKSTRFTVYGPTNAPRPSGELAAIGVPVMSSTVTSWLSVGGWAVDLRAPSGPGVDVVQVWAYPNPGSGSTPLFLGNAPYGRARGDVGALFGSKFTNSGFHLDVMGMAEGTYDIVVLPKSTVSNAYEVARVARVTVRPSIVMNLDAPSANQTVPTTFTVSGWAFDRRSTAAAGVDVLHVWAYPAGAGTTPVFVGVAGTGVSRPDVAAAYGSQYSHSGYSLVGSLPVGSYDLVLFAHSTVSNNFENARVVRIKVQ